MHADRFEPLPDDVAARWATFGRWERTYFPRLVGLEIEELRADYCRMRRPTGPSSTSRSGSSTAARSPR